MNKIAKYVLNPDGTVPWFVTDGGYFPDSRVGDSPQDWTLVGIVDGASGLEGFADVDALVAYLESIGGLEWTDMEGEPTDLFSQATFLWDRMNALTAE